MEITTKLFFFFFVFFSFFLHTWLYLLMTQALNMLVIPWHPSYNGVEVYYLKGVIGLPIVISFRDRWYIHIFFFLEMGPLMTSSSSAGPIQISKFPEPWFGPRSDCSSRSSLIWVHTVCRYAKIGLKSLQEYSADDINRRHFQRQFFLAL